MAAAPISRDHSCDHSLVVVLGLLAPRERLGRARDALPVRGRRRARERDDGGQERVPDLVRGRVRVRVGVRVGVGVRTKVWLGLGLVRDLRAEIEQVEVERGLCKARPKRVSSRAIPPGACLGFGSRSLWHTATRSTHAGPRGKREVSGTW